MISCSWRLLRMKRSNHFGFKKQFIENFLSLMVIASALASLQCRTQRCLRMRAKWLKRSSAAPAANTSHDEAAGARVRYSGAFRVSAFARSLVNPSCSHSSSFCCRISAKTLQSLYLMRWIFTCKWVSCWNIAAFYCLSLSLPSETHSKDDQHQGHIKVAFPFIFCFRRSYWCNSESASPALSTRI